MAFREPVTHVLKIWPEYFQAVLDGRKRFELRKNDRDFRVHDTLILEEYEPGSKEYSGRSLTVTVSYAFYGPAWGLPIDMALLSTIPVDRESWHLQITNRRFTEGIRLPLSGDSFTQTLPKTDKKITIEGEQVEDEMKRTFRSRYEEK